MDPEPEFQIYQCSNPDCRFRFANNLSVRTMQDCPICGVKLAPQGSPFTNARRTTDLPEQENMRRMEVVLDNLRSTLNVGSIFRTADGAGVAHIYCCGTTPTPEHPKIEKTGLGAEGFLPWTLHRNALDLILEKKSDGFQIISMKLPEIHPPYSRKTII
jgi:tRNA G18 (ribose-2'-O)-methylase SpoU